MILRGHLIGIPPGRCNEANRSMSGEFAKKNKSQTIVRLAAGGPVSRSIEEVPIVLCEIQIA